jgi:hypothetical protein
MTRNRIPRFALVFAAAVAAPAVVTAQHHPEEMEKTRAQRQELREERRAARLDAQQQRQLILEQQRWNQQYKTYLQRQELAAQRQATQYERARRLAQYRYQQQYLQALRDQRMALSRSYDYENDPYYYTAPSFRYTRNGRVYQTNQYGADMLRQAVNYGYAQGVQAGQADRSDGFRGDYRKTYAYQDASYGYTGRYVPQSDYSYYFREGFRRGYQDGYVGRLQYGTGSGSTFNILSNVLSTILNLSQLN